MTTPLADLADRFRFDNRFLGILADGLEHLDWLHWPDGGGNPALWILGHLAGTRRVIRRMLGEDLEVLPWEALYGMGSEPDDAGDGPGPEALIGDFKASGDALSFRLDEITAEEAATPQERTFPDGSNTLEGAMHFFYFHEVYHFGQLGLIRRMRGKDGFA